MKRLILALFVVVLSNCASTEVYSPDDLKAAACFDKQDNSLSCDNIRLYMDPYRHHKLSDWQKKHLPEIPDLP